MSDALAPGLLITPTIRLSRELGRGGMGSVWIADHLRLQTQVVVKFMSAEHVSTPDVLARFEREASLGAQAKSPHVVQVFDHGISAGGLPYIAMELLEGEDLGKRLARGGVIAPRVFAGWLSQACRGLSRAHSKGIVHRDIKPENLFLCDYDGEVLVKVLDFGIAKGLAAGKSFSGTATGALLGTPYYMSPEQTMGAKDIDHRTDLWSLGVVTYFALTGVRPFEHDSIGAIVSAITSRPIPPPSSFNTALPFGIDAWMARALARDPSQRFASAKEMAESFYSAAGRASLAPGEATALAPAAPAWDSSPTHAEPRTSSISPSSRTSAFSPRATARFRLVGVGAGLAGLALAAAVAIHSRMASPEPARPPAASAPLPPPTPPPPVEATTVTVLPPPSEDVPAPEPPHRSPPAPPASKGYPVETKTSPPPRPKAVGTPTARPARDVTPGPTAADPMKMPLE